MKKIFLFLALFSANALATPVNINTADAQTIAGSLGGVGEKKAQAIIEYREKNGDFKTVESLMDVKGIGVETFEKNKKDLLLKGAGNVIKKEGVKKIDSKIENSKTEDSKKIDVKKEESKKVDAKKVDAKKVDAKKVDAKKVDAKKVDAKKAKSKEAGSKKVDSKKEKDKK